MPNAQVVVRGYEPSDEHAVLALAPQLRIGVAPWRDPDAVGQSVAGWVRDSLDHHRYDDRADQERGGIGTLLMRSAEQWARHRGLRHLTLETGALNEAARAFYARLGYQQEDIRLTTAL